VIVQILSVIIPESQASAYLEELQSHALPIYECAQGLVSISVLQRPVVAYHEVMLLSLWRSERALERFQQEHNSVVALEGHGRIQLEPHTFELVCSCRGKAQEENGPA
jgi:heme-degrading monooxygenase HmoA